MKEGLLSNWGWRSKCREDCQKGKGRSYSSLERRARRRNGRISSPLQP